MKNNISRQANARLRTIRILVTFLSLAAAFGVADQVSAASLDRVVDFNIDSQPLQQALIVYSRQADIQVVLNEGAKYSSVPALRRKISAGAGLNELLNNTGYSYKLVGERTISITSDGGGGTDSEPHALNEESSARDTPKRGSGISASEGSDSRIGEVVVTAEKREERLQDVPIPVSVLSVDSLISSGMTNLQDYYGRVPGLNFRTGLGDTPAVTIRGLTTGGFSNPAVGVTIDDAPYGASTALGGGFQVLDIDPSDLSHIEVLRGPQGTLYGASSIGGLIKYVTVAPSLDRFSGGITTGTESVNNGKGLGYSLRGSINAPLSEWMAVRASAFTRHDTGFIDDPIHRIDGLNNGDSYGGRLAVLLSPNDNLSMKVDALHQYLETRAGPSVDFPATDKDLKNSTYVPDYQGSRRKVTFLTNTVKWKLGGAEITSITAYARTNADMRNTIPQLNTFAKFLGGDSTAYQDLETVSKFSQELHVSVPLGSHIDWLGGLFYTNEHGRHHEFASPAIQESGELLGEYGSMFDALYPSSFREYAAFTDLTVRFTDKFDTQIGARESRNEQELNNTTGGLLAGGKFQTTGVAKSKDNAATFLLSPRFKITEDLMVYARVADGYRPGGPNYNTTIVAVAKPTVSADKTHNYEVGAKGDIFGRALSVDASAYYIRWDNIQVTLVDPVTGRTYLANAGQAKSKGVELSLQSRPADGLALTAWGAWNNAYVVDGIPGAQSGEQLPFSSRFSASATADYERPIYRSAVGIAGTALSYVGKRDSAFGPLAPKIPAFAQWDLHVGLDSDGWRVNAYVNNVLNRRGIDSIDYFGSVASIIKPRTCGLSITNDF
jgi:iron complex outermembrane recepter protein